MFKTPRFFYPFVTYQDRLVQIWPIFLILASKIAVIYSTWAPHVYALFTMYLNYSFLRPVVCELHANSI